MFIITNMSKTILITGSTDGIGKLAATQFATNGHVVYLHGRNADKLAATISEIKTISQNKQVHGFIADFSDLNSVHAMILQIQNEVPKLDVLINNAGIFKSPISKSKDDIDIRFAVNYFAPYILTQQLIPLLEKSTQPRIVNLSSAAQSPVSLNALVGQEEITTQAAYAQSKLALTMWNTYLAMTYKNITSIAVNPGSLLNTKMANEAYGQHWSPADKGANILYDLAITEAYIKNSGAYFDNDKGDEKGHFSNAHPDATNQEKIQQLITTTDTFLASL
ncbi:NAD(P)-dependent dehydrogenase, short-chain alcohol dehydrogenase family [Dokdonia pacifica]|uniref:NAD(P)-dependent dehydrogenase, short-chain alcohol dehydrogenase family n=2 Tax=Dokdonia pacifica TaxID=1627892 RepID=A0A239B169_9FLAO|nr:NAD(P)-dependent dehydrogenase, short-chain alcohol dehydrogenase family [Dokdonia pacifica]